MRRRRDDKKILLFRPRFTYITQKMLLQMVRKGVERKHATIIDMKDAKAALRGRKTKSFSRRAKSALNKKRF
jgi:hypothetical protein